MAALVVVDTNVLVSGLLAGEPNATVRHIVDAMLAGQFPFLLSEALLREYRQVLLRPHLQRLHGLTEAETDIVLTELTANGLWREPGDAPPAPDPGDNHLWALLATQPGSILVTGDRRLLENPPDFASVLSPKSFLRLLTTQLAPRNQ